MHRQRQQNDIKMSCRSLTFKYNFLFMKKIILMAVMAVATLTASAQVYVAGAFDLGVNSVKLGDADAVSTTNFSLSPEVGYNFNEMWAVGAELGFGVSKTDDVDAITSWRVSPYVRCTFGELGSGVKMFAEAYYAHKWYSQDSADWNGWGVGVRPGVSVALGSKWSLVGKMVLFQYSKFDETKTTTFQIAPSEVSLGVSYNF